MTDCELQILASIFSLLAAAIFFYCAWLNWQAVKRWNELITKISLLRMAERASGQKSEQHDITGRD